MNAAQDCGCSRPPSPTLLAAVRQFNEGKYFLCHETLEDLWLSESEPLRRLYQGMLQVGIGLLHLQNGNERGALLLLTRGSELLAPFAPACLGLDIAALLAGARQVLESLAQAGAEQTLERAAELFPRIRLVELPASD